MSRRQRMEVVFQPGAALKAPQRREITTDITRICEHIAPLVRLVGVRTDEDYDKFAGWITIPGTVRANLIISPSWITAPRSFRHIVLIHEVLHTTCAPIGSHGEAWSAQLESLAGPERQRMEKVMEEREEQVVETLAFVLAELGL